MLIILCCFPPPILAFPLWQPNLAKLGEKADLILVGEITNIQELEPVIIDYNTEKIKAVKMVAILKVDHIVKGSVSQKDLSFEFPVSGYFRNQRKIPLYQFGMFFLKTNNSLGALTEFTVADVECPFVVAVPGNSPQEGTDIENIVNEIIQVLLSQNSLKDECDEAITLLTKLNGVNEKVKKIITDGLHKIVQTRDFPLKLQAAETLLEEGDLSYLDLVVEYALNPPYLNNEQLECIGLPLLKDPKVLPTLIRLINLPCDDARRSVFDSIAEIGGAAAIEPLIQALYDRDQRIRYRGVLGLARITRQIGQDGWGPGIELFEKDERKYLTHWREWAAEWKILQEKNKSVSPPPSNKK